MNSNGPLFSIIIPTHNGAGRITTALKSIADQTFKGYELIVVCDACTDNSAWIAETYGAKVITVDYRRDGMARNAGIDEAKGEWILFMDDDDWYMNNHCLETIAREIGKQGEDVLDFGFEWQGKGRMTPTTDAPFVMAWSRAWRRSFIGTHRFSGEPYGADVTFWKEMIKNNPGCKVAVLNEQIYYYNYMREGSMTWMEKKKSLFDIIVTHHDEPWEVGRKFFHMLSLQRNVDFHQFRVILVQDGPEGALNWEDLFRTCPYEVEVVTIEHVGPAGARNAGIQHATSEFVMFCDFDDMFSDVFSVSMITNVLPTNEADILWMDCYREQRVRGKGIFVNNVHENFTEAYGKLFRRSFLEKENIFFPDMEEGYDYVFGFLALACAAPARTMRITTKFGLYAKTLRIGSFHHRKECAAKRVESMFYADVYLVQEFRSRKRGHDMLLCIANTVFDSYFMLNSTPRIPHHKEIFDLFREFYRTYRQEFDLIRPTEMEVIEQDCNKRMMSTVLALFNDFLIEPITPDPGIKKIRKWLETLDTKPAVQPVRKLHAVKNDERVVVYSGTRNTYENILASMKSLFANNRVDKVYLLIEDDTFPYEVPDCVTVMNVSDQTFFPEHGPNYNNTWSYMCLMRGAYTKLLPQHSRILSLDIDTVVDDSIDELWNLDMDGYYLAGVHENERPQPDYVNFGIVMMNLDLIRKDGIDDKVIDLLNTSKQGCPEQDAFSKLCAGKILLLDSRFNYTPFTGLIKEPEHEVIIHYAGIQFWKNFSAVQKYMRMSWDDVYRMAEEKGVRHE